MVITHKVNMDLARRGNMPRIDVVQDDKYSRNLNIRLYENGVAFLPPEGCHVLIRFSKPDRTGGAYDAMPDGSEAWKIEGNELTVGLAPQVCTVSGRVRLMVSLLCGDAELNTFAIELNVQERVAFVGTSQEYINIQWFVPQPASAKVGDYLRVKEVDDRGRILAVDTFYSEAPDHRHDASEIISGVFDVQRIPGEILSEAKKYADSRNRRNLLDNSDFRNLVNQRGARSYSGSVYSIDRWRQWSAESTCTVQDGYVTCSGTNLQQYLEYYDPDKIYTVAACAIDGTIWALSGKFADAPSDAHFNLDVSSAGYATVGLKAGSWVWAALYEGEYTAETLPAYQPKGYAAELLECQRYYLKPISQAIGFASSETTALIPINTPVQMRTTPTVSGTINWFRTEGAQLAASSVANAAFASSSPAGNAIVITLSGLTGLTVHKAVYLAIANFELSADL